VNEVVIYVVDSVNWMVMSHCAALLALADCQYHWNVVALPASVRISMIQRRAANMAQCRIYVDPSSSVLTCQPQLTATSTV